MKLLLLDFFHRETQAPKVAIFLMAALAGLSSGLLLAIVNNSTAIVSNNEEVQARVLLLYVSILALMVYSRRFAVTRSITAVEAGMRRVRVRIADKIRHAELRFIEEKGEAEIYARLTNDTTLISQSALMITSAFQALLTLFFSLLYLATLSPASLVITLVGIAAAAYAYLHHYDRSSALLRETIQREAEFLGTLSGMLNGFKELRVNRARSDDIFDHACEISKKTERLKAEVGTSFAVDEMFSQVFYYLLLAVLIFLMPMLVPTHSAVIIKVIAVVLFIMSPVESVVSAIPMYTRATVAVENLVHLEAEVEAHTREHDIHAADSGHNPFRNFSSLQLDQLMFQFYDEDGRTAFSTGPINLTITRGELLFVVGGNGSGKSTLMKLLTGLYFPTDGFIRVDGQAVERRHYPDYRELFSIIFTDFYLFDRLYGLPDIPEAQVNRLLKRMEIDTKTRFQGGRFSHIKLSTGQRKRLAFVTACLEDRPIIVLDEWAADQDPQFRHFFYHTLLKELQAAGKTVIAVSHDDHYFHLADRVIKMEYGQLATIAQPQAT